MRFSASLDLAFIRADDQDLRVIRMRLPVEFAPEDAHAAGIASRVGEFLDIERIVFVGDGTHDRQDLGAWHVVGFLKIFEFHAAP